DDLDGPPRWAPSGVSRGSTLCTKARATTIDDTIHHAEGILRGLKEGPRELLRLANRLGQRKAFGPPPRGRPGIAAPAGGRADPALRRRILTEQAACASTPCPAPPRRPGRSPGGVNGRPKFPACGH